MNWRRIRNYALAIHSVALFVAVCVDLRPHGRALINGHENGIRVATSIDSQIANALCWLPEETETIRVIRGPIALQKIGDPAARSFAGQFEAYAHIPLQQ